MLALPPYKRGLYARDTVEPGAWGMVAVDGRRSDRATQVAEALRRGASVFLYSTPEAWRPDTWRASLNDLAVRAQSLRCDGIIADPEGGWDGRMAEATALGDALGALGARMSVGVTSYPSWPGMPRLARAAGMNAWGSPQLYGATRAPSARLYASWIRPWDDAFGGRVIPSIAGWEARESYSTPAGFAAYLATLPRRGGFIAWDARGTMPRHIRSALLSYDAGVPGLHVLNANAGILIAVAVCVAVAVFAAKGMI